MGKINSDFLKHFSPISSHLFIAIFPLVDLYNVSFVNDNLETVNSATNMKRIDLNIKHNSNSYPLISESFIISNL